MHRISELPLGNAGRRIVMQSPGRIGSLLLNTRPIIVEMPDMVGSKSMEDIAAVGSRQIEMGF
jgi:hypothetical protein